MMNYKKLALTVAAGAMATTMMAQSAPQLNANNIDEVIKAMTLEEKAQMYSSGPWVWWLIHQRHKISCTRNMPTPTKKLAVVPICR